MAGFLTKERWSLTILKKQNTQLPFGPRLKKPFIDFPFCLIFLNWKDHWGDQLLAVLGVSCWLMKFNFSVVVSFLFGSVFLLIPENLFCTGPLSITGSFSFKIKQIKNFKEG